MSLPRPIGVAVAAVTAAVSLAICGQAAAVPRQFFGVDAVTYPTAAEFQRIAQAGVGICRTQFYWGAAEPTPGVRNYAVTDDLVGNAARAGVDLLPEILGSAPWVSSKLARPPLRTARARAAFGAILQDWAARYGTRGTFWSLHPELPYRPVVNWEIWNEPNLGGFFGGKPNARAFARLIKLSAAGLRAGDPAAQVITGGVFPRHTLPNTVAMDRFLDAFYRVPGIKRAFDGLGVHPYASSPHGVLSWIKKVRRVMRRHGDGGTPIWATEFGWTTGGRLWRRSHFRTTLAGQAYKVTRTYQLLQQKAAAVGLASAVYFSFEDTTPVGPDFWVYHEGLIRRDGSPKPAWYAYARVAGGTP